MKLLVRGFRALGLISSLSWLQDTIKRHFRKGLLWGLPILASGLVLLFTSFTTQFESLFDDQLDYTSELVKAYQQLSFYGSNGSYYSLVEETSDEIVVPQRGGDWYDGGVHAEAHKQTYNANFSLAANSWGNIYSAIVVCNKQLFQYSKISTSDVNIYKAELRVLRAYYYYLLLDAFRKVPIVISPFPASPGLPAQNSNTELFNFIESEITASLPDLSNAPIYGRFNQSGAKAILAKLYLNATVYTGQTKWNEASTACDDIINTGYYSLTADFFQNFKANNNTSPEIIFQIPFDAVTFAAFNMHLMSLHPESQRTFNLQQQPWNGYSSAQDFYNSYQSTDLRKSQFLVGIQRDTTTHTSIVDPGYDGDPDGAVLNFTPAITSLTGAYRQDGARIFKWRYELGAGISLNNDFAIFRLSDVLLMKSEAQFRLGNTAIALSLLNQIRARAGLSALGSMTLQDLLDERGREFFAETWRRQDLIRFGAFNAAWWEKPASPSYVNVFPIPAIQITNNPNLTQNTGY